MEKKTPPQKEYFFDFATILTVSGILLYYLGWMYWEKYFLTLSIRSSLIDIPFDKIISSTWFIIILLILSFLYTFQQIYDNKKMDKVEIIDLTWFILFPIYICLQSKIPDGYDGYVLWGGMLLYILIKILQRFNKIPQKHLTKQKSLIIVVVVIYIFGIYFYRDKGERDALSLKNSYSEDVSLTMKNGEKKYGKFIVFMNNKYFIIVENAYCKKETIIVSDGEVTEAKFIE